jgi:hypothetical protein
MHQKHAAAQRGQRLVQLLSRPRARNAFQAVENPGLVALGLQLAEKPRAGVRERLVVQVDRVLRGQHHADAGGARLLQQGQQRKLRRRVGNRRKVAEHFVHIEQRPQRRAAALPARPFDCGVQHQRDGHHALGLVEVRDRNDRDARAPFRVEQHAGEIGGLTLHPDVEPRCGENAVEAECQFLPVARWIEALQVHDADAVERGAQNLFDQARKVRLRVRRRVAEQRGDERLFAAVWSPFGHSGQ